MNPLIIIYLKCFFVAMLGCLLQAILKIQSLKQKAKAGNAEFNPASYFKEDRLSIMASIITVILVLFTLDEKLLAYLNTNLKLTGLFAFVGYTGSSVASRFFSVVDKRLNNVIDYKTNEADKAKENV